MDEKWFWQAEPWLFGLRACTLLLALLALQFSAVPWLAGLLIHAVVLVYACCLLVGERRSRGQAGKQGLCYRQGGWQLWQPQQGWRPIELSGQTLVLPGLVVLTYRLPGRLLHSSSLITARMAGAEAHRRLRVCLRFLPLTETGN